MNNEDAKDYKDVPNDPIKIGPARIGEAPALHQHEDNDDTRPLGQAQDINRIPDSPLVDGNAQEANNAIEDTAEES